MDVFYALLSRNSQKGVFSALLRQLQLQSPAAAAATTWRGRHCSVSSRRLLLPLLLLTWCGVFLLLCVEEGPHLLLAKGRRSDSGKKGENKKHGGKRDEEEGDQEKGRKEADASSEASDEVEDEAQRGKQRKRGGGKKGDASKTSTNFSFCSNGLRDAVNAAILELAGEHFVANVLLPQFPAVPYVPILTCPTPEMPPPISSDNSSYDSSRPYSSSSSSGKNNTGQSNTSSTQAADCKTHGKKCAAAAASTSGAAASTSGMRGASSKEEGLPKAAAGGRGGGGGGGDASPSQHVDNIWPDINDIQPTDLLNDVLDDGKLRVAGLGPPPPRPPPSAFPSESHYNSWTSLQRKEGGQARAAARGGRVEAAGGRGTGGNSLPAPARGRKRQGGDGGSEGGESGRQTGKEGEKTGTKGALLSQTDRGFNWGEEGDYTLSKPTGYFPTYMRAIAQKISQYYGRPVEVVWHFFSAGSDCLQSVKQGLTHMTDLYFLSAYQKDSSSMWESFSRTCPVSGSPNLFITLKEYNIHSLQDLVRHLRMSADPKQRTIAYLSAGNFETIQHFLPAHTLSQIMSKEEAERRIAAKTILGSIRTGSTKFMPPEFAVVDLGLVLAQVPYFSRTDVPQCLYHQLLMREAARSNRGGASKKNKKHLSSSSAAARWGGGAACGHLSRAGAAAAIAAFLGGIAVAAL